MTFPPAAPRGIGLATPEPVAPPTSAPPAAPPAPTPQEVATPVSTLGEQIGVPQFSDDPIGALGFLLQQFSAGFQGRELPSTRLRREALERQQLELRQIQVASQVLREGISLLEQVPEEQRGALIDQFTGTFADSMPGVKDILTELSTDLPSAKKMLSIVGEFAPQLYAMCGSDVACIRKFATDDNFTTFLTAQRDRRNRPIVGSKLREITQVMHSHADSLDLPRDEMGDFVLGLGDIERLNSQLPEELQLTPSEFATLERNPDMLLRYGIVTPEMQEFMFKEEFKSRLRMREDAAKEAVKSRFSTDKAKSDLLDDRGNVKSEVSNDIFKRISTLLGARVDPLTGIPTADSPDVVRDAQDFSLTAVSLLQSGRANSVDEAISMAMGRQPKPVGTPLPEIEQPEVPIPEDKREEIAAQQVVLHQMRPLVEARLDDVMGVGFVAKLKELSSETVGQAFESFTFPKNAQARQRLREMNQAIKGALAVNAEAGRISNQDMMFVLELLPPVDTWFANETIAAQQMRQILDFFDERIAHNEALLSGRKPEAQKPANAAPKLPKPVEQMTPKEADDFVAPLTKEQLKQLPPEVLDQLIAKMSGAS